MFGRTFPLFTLFGFRVRVHPSWALLAILMTVTMAGALVEMDATVEPAASLGMGLLYAIGMLLSIVWHETSHALVARHHGMKVRAITLFMLGGVAELEDEPPTPRSELLMAIAGPLASFVLALLIAGATWAAFPDLDLPLAGVMLAYLVLGNVMLGVFNLVPAFPLDGGRVLRAILWWWRGDAIGATRIASAIGAGFGVLLMGIGVALVYKGDGSALMLILIGFFLARHARAPYRALLVAKRLETRTVASLMRPPPKAVSRAIPVSELVEILRAAPADEPHAVVDGTRLVGLVNTRLALGVPDDERASRTAGEISVPPDARTLVDGDTRALDALDRMGRARVSTMLVTRDGEIVGTLVAADLLAAAFAP